MSDHLRIAARKSDLARLQAVHVGQLLQRAHPGLAITFQFSESLGDKNQNDPLWKMPEKGVFTSDLSRGLVEDQHDLVVHSWKDLPIESDALVLGAPPRADARDVVLFAADRMQRWQNGGRLRVLSSSPRRSCNLGACLASLLPHPPGEVEFVPVRGNIPTRVRKLLEGEGDADALVVAKAAIDRLLDPPDDSFHPVRDQLRVALASCRWIVVPLSLNPSAPAQGALALEARAGDVRVRALVEQILCQQTTEAVRAERESLARYGGGCHQKIGVSVVPTPWGQVRFERGETSSDGPLRHRSLTSASSKTDGSALPWSSTLAGVTIFDREPMNGSTQVLMSTGDAAWYVSHPDALPAGLVPHDLPGEVSLWTSGLMTWRRLVARGFWVEGCDDGLGEGATGFADWHGRSVTRRKLGHEGSPELGEGLATYRLVPRPVAHPREAWRLAGRTHFYWKSGSQFDAVTAVCPEVRDAHHACGPGHTARYLAARVSRLEVCLDEQEWRDRHGFHRFD